MPLALLSKPVGASGNWVATETRANVRAAAAMKSFMDSASSSGLGEGLMCKYHLACLPHRSKKRKLPKWVRPFAVARNTSSLLHGPGTCQGRREFGIKRIATER